MASGNGKPKPKNGTPSTNGRDGNGKFTPGNKGGPGNPHADNVGKYRARLFACLTPEDFDAVVLELIDKAKDGNAWAIKELLDRVIGKPKEHVEITGEFTLARAVREIRDELRLVS